MLISVVTAVKSTITRLTGTVGQAVKRLFMPAGAIGAVTAATVHDAARSRSELIAENALLRQQLVVLRRSVKRPQLGRTDRVLMIAFSRFNHLWREALHIVQPDTLLRWHRDLFKIVWRRKSRPKGQPRRIAHETIELIQTMAISNATWGAERIRGELLKLGVRVSKRTIQKYMRLVRPAGKTGQTWRTFLENHSDATWACDFLQLYDVCFRPIFAFFIVKHGSREVVHVNVTRSPSDEWVAQQLREATPYGEGPRYLIRDNDGKFGSRFGDVAKGAGIDVVQIPAQSPNLNPICERFLGALRRECLDHVIILGENHLRRVLQEWVSHFNVGRPHQGLGQRIPSRLAAAPVEDSKGDIVAFPILGGLHHDYRRAA